MRHSTRFLTSSLRGSAVAGGGRSLSLCILAIVATLAMAPASGAFAQDVFPLGATEMFFDNFEAYTDLYYKKVWDTSTPYWQWQQMAGFSSYNNWGHIEDDALDRADNGIWGSQHLEFDVASDKYGTVFIIRDSIPPSGPDGAQNPNPLNYDPADWENLRIEFDVYIKQYSVPGVFWNMTSVDDASFPEGKAPADGYVFYLTDDYGYWCHNDTTCGYATHVPRWHLAKIQGFDRLHNVSGQTDWVNLADGELIPKIPGTATPATTGGDATITGFESVAGIKSNRIFRFKLDWFCGNLRVQYLHPWGDTGTHPADSTYYGCASAGAPTGICTGANIDDCWCEIIQVPMAGIDSSPITTAGMVGLYNGGGYTTYTLFQNFRWDNLRVSTFAGGCGEVCDPWLDDWTTVATDTVPFKFLYEGALMDFSTGRNITPPAQIGKIDVATEPPTTTSSYNNSLDGNPYCNGWNLLQDLPAANTVGGNINDITEFLDPMAKSVGYDHAGLSWLTGSPYWEPNSGDPAYNPLPMVTDGTTPINSSLLQAYDWYKAQVTTGDYAADPFEGCRQWYLVLITDGSEACEFEACTAGEAGCNQQMDGTWKKFDYDKVCEDEQGADKFANPPDTGVPPLPIYTIGFSESIAEDSALACIASQTGGQFMTAASQSELEEALFEVYYNLESQPRSFAPFKVTPPPSSAGGSNFTRDYLAVYPLFTPTDGQSLWSGNLYGFRLNKDQPTLPTVNDCQLDTSVMVWDAASALQDQLDNHTEANPQRFVFFGSDHDTSLARYNFKDIPYDTDIRDAFGAMIGLSVSKEIQQVANFVRNIYQDDDTILGNDGPPTDPRPDGYPVYGEFYHSQPTVVNPPNSPMYFYDYGFGVAGESGVHNYQDFMTQHAKRRRVVLAGSGDGMLHALDGGVWDRDRDDDDPATDTYDEIHDLGTGTELFAWVPQAVMHNLYNITAGDNFTSGHNSPRYMVDGPTVVSDAYIDHDNDSNTDPEWRTVALTSMRRGGRGILALDITRPDPVGSDPDYVPGAEKFPGCLDPQTQGCEGEEWPRVLWEFSDETDADNNHVSGDPVEDYWDLGYTWSKPAIARIAINDGSNPPLDTFVAFFGGGWDDKDSYPPDPKFDPGTPGDTSDDYWVNKTGNFFYGVDLATGAVLIKKELDVDVPGGVTALDSDNDGFHDRIYFADTDGSVWRLQYPEPTDSAATGALAGTFTRIFDFRTAFSGDRQEFYTRPIPVPIKFDGSKYTWALALGSGDRSRVAWEDNGIDHFFFLVDAGDTTIRGVSHLTEISYASLNASFDCSGSEPLVPPKYGWYLTLRPDEKVMFDATVINGYVQFPTFDPTATTASHNVPDQCGESPETVDLDDICYANGLGRTYKLWYECGLGDYVDHTDIITGSEDYTIDDTTYVSFTTSNPDGPEGPDDTSSNELMRTHTSTNWRQE